MHTDKHVAIDHRFRNHRFYGRGGGYPVKISLPGKDVDIDHTVRFQSILEGVVRTVCYFARERERERERERRDEWRESACAQPNTRADTNTRTRGARERGRVSKRDRKWGGQERENGGGREMYEYMGTKPDTHTHTHTNTCACTPHPHPSRL